MKWPGSSSRRRSSCSGHTLMAGPHPTQAHTDSDVDLLVIMPQRRMRGRMSTHIRWAVPRIFPLDLLVRSGSEVNRRLQWGDCFLQKIVAKGKVLYEASHFRYPGHSATLREARTAMKHCCLIRAAVRHSLGLKT